MKHRVYAYVDSQTLFFLNYLSNWDKRSVSSVINIAIDEYMKQRKVGDQSQEEAK